MGEFSARFAANVMSTDTLLEWVRLGPIPLKKIIVDVNSEKAKKQGGEMKKLLLFNHLHSCSGSFAFHTYSRSSARLNRFTREVTKMRTMLNFFTICSETIRCLLRRLTLAFFCRMGCGCGQKHTELK